MKPILIIQNAQIVTPGTITDYLEQNNIAYNIVHSYQDQSLPELDEIDFVINLGSDLSMRDYFCHNHLKKVSHYVKELLRQKKNYLGICFSGQMLANVLDADIDKNNSIEIGVADITLTKAGLNDPIFENIKQCFKTFQWHGDCFSIPEGCVNLAKSAITKNQAFRHQNAIGLQFHPEADLSIVKNWVEAFPNDVKESKQTADEIISDYQTDSEQIKAVNFQLLDNFIKL